MELLQCNIWWLEGLEFISNGFANNRALGLHHKGIHYVGNIWDKEYHTFIAWDDALTKFDLTSRDCDDWVKLTTYIINKWRSTLEGDVEVMVPGQWVGL